MPGAGATNGLPSGAQPTRKAERTSPTLRTGAKPIIVAPLGGPGPRGQLSGCGRVRSCPTFGLSSGPVGTGVTQRPTGVLLHDGDTPTQLQIQPEIPGRHDADGHEVGDVAIDTEEVELKVEKQGVDH